MTGEMLSGTMDELDLIERHILMLNATKENQPVGIIRLSELTGIPKHKVRYSLRLLERDGLIVATPDGAMVTDGYDAFMKDISERLVTVVDRVNEIRERIAEDTHADTDGNK